MFVAVGGGGSIGIRSSVGIGCSDGGDRGGELLVSPPAGASTPSPPPSLLLFPRGRSVFFLDVVVVGVVGELLRLLLLPPAARGSCCCGRRSSRRSSGSLPLLLLARGRSRSVRGGRGEDAAGDHLGSHVLGRADARRRRGVDRARQAKVDHFQSVQSGGGRRGRTGTGTSRRTRAHDGVLRLEVAVAEARAVHRRDGRRELLEEARGERLRDAAVGRALDEREEVGPADELPLLFLGCFTERKVRGRVGESWKKTEKGERRETRESFFFSCPVSLSPACCCCACCCCCPNKGKRHCCCVSAAAAPAAADATAACQKRRKRAAKSYQARRAREIKKGRNEKTFQK